MITKLLLVIAMGRLKFMILLRKKELVAFRDIMEELVVWIGLMGYWPVDLETDLWPLGISGWELLIDIELIVRKFVG